MKKKRQEPTPPRYTKTSAKMGIERPKRPRTTGASKKDDDFEDDNNMDTADGNYEEFSSDEDMEKVRKFVRETQPRIPSQFTHASTEEIPAEVHPPPAYLPNTPMPPGLSQYELSASASGARTKMLTKASEEPCREKVRAGDRPLPRSLSNEAVPTELSQGELSTSLPDIQAQVPPGPTDAPGQGGVWAESRPPPT